MAGPRFIFGRLMDSFSKIVSESESSAQKLSPQQKAHQQEIENSILVLAAEVIRCDKNFTSTTENFILDFLYKQFGSRPKQERLKTIYSHIETGTEPFTKIACKELTLLTTHQSRITLVGFLLGVAASDDFLNPKETRIIHRMAGYLGVNEKDFKDVKRVFLSANSPYAVLGIEEDADIAEVKSAYRKMVLKYHPDKRETKITEEEASIRFREIQKAYETILNKLVLQ